MRSVSDPARGRAGIAGIPAAALLAVALFVLEVWLLRQWHDTDALGDSQEWWAPWIRSARHNTPWALSVLGATAALGWRRIAREVARALGEPDSRWSFGLRVGLHGLAFVAFHALTTLLVAPSRPAGLWSTACAIAWVLAGASTILTLAGLVFPMHALAGFLRRTAGTWLGGLGMGTVAFLVARHVVTDWPFWEPLARATLWASHKILALLVDEVRYEPEGLILGTKQFPVHITRACTGYEGMALFAVFLGAFLLLQRERLRFPRALLLLPAGMALCWLANVARVVGLILMGDRVSPELAIEGFHVYAGWPLVIGVALCAVFVATRWPALANATAKRGRAEPGTAGTPSSDPVATEHASAGSRTVNPVAAYLGPLLVVVTVTFLAGAFVRDRIWGELACSAGVLAAVLFYRREYALERPSGSGALLLLGLVAAITWILLLELTGAQESPPRPQPSAPGFLGPVGTGLHVLVFVVVTPLAEELALRGYLARRLVNVDFEAARLERGNLAAFVVPALVAGALEAHVLPGIAASLVFSFAARRRGRVLDAVAVHAITNALIAGYSILTEDRAVWS